MASPLRGAKSVTLSGQTYQHRDRIKQFGGRWDAAAKVWRVPVVDTMHGRSSLSGLIAFMESEGITVVIEKPPDDDED